MEQTEYQKSRTRESSPRAGNEAVFTEHHDPA